MSKQILIVFILSLLSLGCTVPQYIWPQNDLNFQEINQPTLSKKVLIASRNSDFKKEIVQKIKEGLSKQSVYIKIIGIENLKNENANQYSAIVILNTAMAWKADRKVESFLEKFRDLKTIIVLTTSGGGDVFTDTKNRQVDAIASASTNAEVDDVSSSILSKINKLLEN